MGTLTPGSGLITPSQFAWAAWQHWDLQLGARHGYSRAIAPQWQSVSQLLIHDSWKGGGGATS